MLLLGLSITSKHAHLSYINLVFFLTAMLMSMSSVIMAKSKSPPCVSDAVSFNN